MIIMIIDHPKDKISIEKVRVQSESVSIEEFPASASVATTDFHHWIKIHFNFMMMMIIMSTEQDQQTSWPRTNMTLLCQLLFLSFYFSDFSSSWPSTFRESSPRPARIAEQKVQSFRKLIFLGIVHHQSTSLIMSHFWQQKIANWHAAL